jgi:hypothetical protein
MRKHNQVAIKLLVGERDQALVLRAIVPAQASN